MVEIGCNHQNLLSTYSYSTVPDSNFGLSNWNLNCLAIYCHSEAKLFAVKSSEDTMVLIKYGMA